MNALETYKSLRIEHRNMKDPEFWNFISQFHRLSDDFIDAYKDKINWQHLSGNQSFSEQSILKFIKYVDMYRVCDRYYGQLSDDFIISNRKLFNLISLSVLCTKKQNLSEEMIQWFYYQDKSLVEELSQHQKLSLDFIKQHLPKIKYWNLKQDLYDKDELLIIKNLFNQYKDLL
jgi:hypothetical protein